MSADDADLSPRLNVRVLPQPSDSVCGPTCLHALYRYFGDTISLTEVISTLSELPDGGTLAVQLGCHALRRGYSAKIYTNNLLTFDPTWFKGEVDLKEKLKAQAGWKRDNEKLLIATASYLEFLDSGGQIKLEAFTADLLRHYIGRGIPILAGLSATYLYDCPRELDDGNFDDIAGTPTGHFVVLQGYDQTNDHVLVADPLSNNPLSEHSYYSVDLPRLLAAIHLGIVTYDANLLVIEKGIDDPK